MSFRDLFTRNVCQSEIDLADHLAGTPEPTFWAKWFGGVAVPIVLAAIGTRYCILQHAVFYGRGGAELELEGRSAVIFGLGWVSAALFAHFHYFWPTLKRLGIYTDAGKTISLLGIIGTVGYLMWFVLRW